VRVQHLADLQRDLGRPAQRISLAFDRSQYLQGSQMFTLSVV
jgi:hypothetical protein